MQFDEENGCNQPEYYVFLLKMMYKNPTFVLLFMSFFRHFPTFVLPFPKFQSYFSPTFSHGSAGKPVISMDTEIVYIYTHTRTCCKKKKRTLDSSEKNKISLVGA